MEPGQEKDFVAVLRKPDDECHHYLYYLEMKDGDKTITEDLFVYGEAGDPLAPYVGIRVKVIGKQVVGRSTYRTIFPGRLEVLPLTAREKKELEEREQNEAELRQAIQALKNIKRDLGAREAKEREMIEIHPRRLPQLDKGS
jgi:hypothetical protein